MQDLGLSLRDVPTTVAYDQDLVFTVVFTNKTAVDIQLEPCPVFYMAFGESSVGVSPGGWLQLNCGEGRVVPAEDSLGFEMRIENLEEEGTDLSSSTIWWALQNVDDLRAPHGFSVSSHPIEVTEP